MNHLHTHAQMRRQRNANKTGKFMVTEMCLLGMFVQWLNAIHNLMIAHYSRVNIKCVYMMALNLNIWSD